jgi:purine-cytosine permease-like protein
VSFAVINLCVSSQRVFVVVVVVVIVVVVVVYFFIDSVRKLLDTLSYVRIPYMKF